LLRFDKNQWQMCPTHGKESLLTPYERRRMMMEVAEVAFLDSL
jgi:hypothetical protein